MEKWLRKQHKLKETFYTKAYPGGTTINHLLPAMRILANGLGIRFDTWASCTNMCHYCFARALSAGMLARNRVNLSHRHARFGDVKAVEKVFRRVLSEGKQKPLSWVDWAVKNRYFMEVGMLGEPMQPADETYRSTWNLLGLLNAYQYPLYLNTKANLLISNDQYYRAFVELPVKVADIALVGMDDSELGKFEPFAPPASERYKLVKRLVKDNVPVVISCRPILKGVTDKDWEEYIKWLADAGVSSIHLRTLIIVGKLFKRRLWKSYVKEQGMKLFHGEYRYPKEYFIDLFERAIKAAEGTDTHIVGTRRYWFDLAGYHGKAAFDYMPQNVQDALVPFTIHPMFRTLKQHEYEPQLLLWEKLGYPKPENFLDHIVIDNSSACLVFNDCWTRNWRGRYVISGPDFLRLMMWDGFQPGGKIPTGEVTRTHRIYRVYDEEQKIFPRSNKAHMLAYIPPEIESELVRKTKGIGEYVPLKEAKELFAPVRKSMYIPPI